MAAKPTGGKKNRAPRVDGIVAVGLDSSDGHTRVTRTSEMVCLGGTAETHERMQVTAVRFSEGLERRGKELREASIREVIDVLHEALEKTGRG